MKRTVILMTLAAFLVAFASPSFAAYFKDVPRHHWAYDAIEKAVAAGILQGYDGKFYGKRLLNRYQVAVITARLLEAVQKGSGKTMATGDYSKMLANLEALCIEFADELALLNVKVATLEDELAMMRRNMGTKSKTVKNQGEIGFTAFASFGLISDDEDAPGRTRYQGTDSNFFDVPQVSLGVDKQLNDGLYFHAQFDYASSLRLGAANVAINEAYFIVDELFGDIGAKVGAFATPFSMEHNGVFRTLNYTISPSAISNGIENIRLYGLEFEKVKDRQEDDIIWKFGLASGGDGISAFGGGLNYSDAPAQINSGEGDDGFTFWIYLGQKPQQRGRLGKIGWHLGFLDNGGDNGAVLPAVASDETDMFVFGLDWWFNDDLGMLFQYMDISSQRAAGPGGTVDSDMALYFMLVYKVDEKQTLALRFDNWKLEADNNPATTVEHGESMTFAYSRQVTDNSMIQFEYLAPKIMPSSANIDTDLIQLRYKVHF